MIRKRKKLEAAKKHLKKRFAGIDNIIDEIMDLVEPWYILGNTNDRPTVICLWGLTGVGKTDLVSELVKEINMHMQYVRYDMGEVISAHNTFWFKRDMLDELEDLDGENAVLCIDEMQLGRTILSGGMEVDKDFTRALWELIDTGVINSGERYGGQYAELLKLNYLLELSVRKGVKAADGIVTHQVPLHKKITEGTSYRQPHRRYDPDEEDEPILFIPDEYFGDIMSAVPGQFGSDYELMSFLKTLNETEAKDFIHRAMIQSKAPKKINLTNALIFLVGNIDEVYPYDHIMAPDMNAASSIQKL